MRNSQTKIRLALFFMLSFVLSFGLVYGMFYVYKTAKFRDVEYPKAVYFYNQLSNQERLSKGQYHYKLRCFVCHGDQLQGNFKRGKWIEGIYEEDPEKIYKVLVDGIEGKKPPWKQRMQLNHLEDVVLYVTWLQQKQKNKALKK